MQKEKTKIYKFPVDAPVVISTPLHRDHGTRGKICNIFDPTDRSMYDDDERERMGTSKEVQYSVLIKNKKSQAQFLAEDEDNEIDDYEQYEEVGLFYASDLRRDGF